MSKILVLYFSVYGHVEKLAEAIAEGAREGGAQVDVKRVPTINAGKDDQPEREQAAPVATVDELGDYDAVIVGVGTRYGRMAAPMAAFWDQTGPLWAKGALVGKVGSAFTSTATQHGGQETTLMAIHTNLLHHGMVLVGLPYAWQGQMTLDEISGGSPYGITTIAGGKGERQPSENELAGARFQGKHVAEVTAKLCG